VESLICDKEWSLYRKFNKRSCSFKSGFYNAFGIKWCGSESFCFFFNLGEYAEKIQFKELCFERECKRAIVVIKPGETLTQDYYQLFELAYKNLANKNGSRFRN